MQRKNILISRAKAIRFFYIIITREAVSISEYCFIFATDKTTSTTF